jgi:hypothetical protein
MHISPRSDFIIGRGPIAYPVEPPYTDPYVLRRIIHAAGVCRCLQCKVAGSFDIIRAEGAF